MNLAAQPKAKPNIAKRSFLSEARRMSIAHHFRAFAFMSPYLLSFFFFLFLPAVVGFLISLTDWRILGDPGWVELQNYFTVFDDNMFWKAFGNTLSFSVMTVIPMVLGGLLLAVLLNERLHGRLITRTVIFLPYAVMVTIVGILWRWIYDTNFGLANYYLTELGLPAIGWLTKPNVALIAIAITTVWWQIGTNTVIYLAGLQEIPEDLYEAAKVDGANALHRFFYITVPSLRLIHIFVIPLAIINSLRVFGQVLVMTQGGPIASTYTLVQHLYSVGWVNFRQGEAAAVGVILFAITFLLTLIQLSYFGALNFNDPDKASKPNLFSQMISGFNQLLLVPIYRLFTLIVQFLLQVVIDALEGLGILGAKLFAPLNRGKEGRTLFKTGWWKAALGYPIMIIVTLLWLTPIAWMFVTAVKPEGQVRQIPIEWIPQDITFQNFYNVLEAYPITEWFLNSLNVAIITTLFSLFIYILAAFPLAFYRFRGRGVVFLGILATMLIPVEATMIPLFIALARLGIADNYFSLIMPVAANAFGLYLLVQFFQTIPQDLLDSARIDGASEIRILWDIILPLSRPALTTVAILTFMASWNNFVWPFIISNSDLTRTLPVGLATVMGSITGSPTSVQYGIVMAGSVLATLPPMLVFIFLQRYFVRGISMSGIKA
jgi:ABC-type sugar transport system permease subunit